MNSGMYAAVSGNIASQQRLDVITNNLANVNTVGFKRERISFESKLASVKNPTQGTGTLTDEPVMSDIRVATDYSAGSIQQSGNTLDMALEGDGFFVVNTPEGKAYTRQGNFHLDGSSRLVTAAGYEVMGSGGPIVITGGKVEIDSKGTVSVDGNRIATLAIVDFPKPYQLQKSGSSLLIPSEEGVAEQPAKNVAVRQGAVEQSNVNPMLEMAQLIDSNRNYESCIKVVQNYDSIASKAANDLGKV